MKEGTRRLALVGLSLLATVSATPAAQSSTSPEARLKALGIELPAAPKPIASYVTAVRTGNLVFLAGQGPVVDGKPTVTGKVGAELTEEAGYKAARASALTLLSVLRAEIGSLDRVRRVVKLVGWVNSAPGFTRQPWVVNGASDLARRNLRRRRQARPELDWRQRAAAQYSGRDRARRRGRAGIDQSIAVHGSAAQGQRFPHPSLIACRRKAQESPRSRPGTSATARVRFRRRGGCMPRGRDPLDARMRWPHR